MSTFLRQFPSAPITPFVADLQAAQAGTGPQVTISGNPTVPTVDSWTTLTAVIPAGVTLDLVGCDIAMGGAADATVYLDSISW